MMTMITIIICFWMISSSLNAHLIIIIDIIIIIIIIIILILIIIFHADNNISDAGVIALSKALASGHCEGLEQLWLGSKTCIYEYVDNNNNQ